MARDPATLTRLCEYCGSRHSAYRITAKSLSRLTICPTCGAERDRSRVQVRLVWSCYKMIRRIAGLASEKTGVERAYCEDYAHEDALRAAGRYSWLNRPRKKFSSYLQTCLPQNVARWCHDDHAGGVSLRVKRLGETPDDDPDSSPPELSESDDTPSRVATAEQLNRVRAALTATEYDTLESYRDGDIDPDAAGMADLLVKAQRAIQTPVAKPQHGG